MSRGVNEINNGQPIPLMWYIFILLFLRILALENIAKILTTGLVTFANSLYPGRCGWQAGRQSGRFCRASSELSEITLVRRSNHFSYKGGANHHHLHSLY